MAATISTREWTEAERLTQEKLALGFYLSGHPFAAYAAELAPIVRTSLATLQPKNDRVLVAGIVTTLRVQASRRGKMAFVTLDDGKGRAEVLVYNETFDAVRPLLREDQLVIMEIRVTQRVTEDGEAQGLRVIAESVFDLATLRKRWGKGIRTRMQRQCVRRSPRGDPAAVSPRHDADHRPLSSMIASVASWSCPRRGA